MRSFDLRPVDQQQQPNYRIILTSLIIDGAEADRRGRSLPFRPKSRPPSAAEAATPRRRRAIPARSGSTGWSVAAGAAYSSHARGRASRFGFSEKNKILTYRPLPYQAMYAASSAETTMLKCQIEVKDLQIRRLWRRLKNVRK